MTATFGEERQIRDSQKKRENQRWIEFDILAWARVRAEKQHVGLRGNFLDYYCTKEVNDIVWREDSLLAYQGW